MLSGKFSQLFYKCRLCLIKFIRGIAVGVHGYHQIINAYQLDIIKQDLIFYLCDQTVKLVVYCLIIEDKAFIVIPIIDLTQSIIGKGIMFKSVSVLADGYPVFSCYLQVEPMLEHIIRQFSRINVCGHALFQSVCNKL